MSLLKPTPGELVDRATILSLKIINGRLKKKEVRHFEEEDNEVWLRLQELSMEALRDKPWKPFAEWEADGKKLMESLATINGVLWVLEDQVRLTPSDELLKLGSYCLSIARANDKRSDIIQEINKHYFLDTKPEKLYDRKGSMVSDIDLGMQ